MSCLMCGLKNIKFVQRALKAIPDDFPFYNYVPKKERGDVYLGILPEKLKKLFALSILLRLKIDKVIMELKNNPPQTEEDTDNLNDKFGKAMVSSKLVDGLFATSLYFENKNFRVETFLVRISNGNQLEVVTTSEQNDPFKQMNGDEEWPSGQKNPKPGDDSVM